MERIETKWDNISWTVWIDGKVLRNKFCNYRRFQSEAAARKAGLAAL